MEKSIQTFKEMHANEETLLQLFKLMDTKKKGFLKI